MSFPGLTNHIVKIPGSTVTAYLAVHDDRPNTWVYSLWADDGITEESLISTGDLTIEHSRVTPEQVGRIAFLLDVEYKNV